LRQVTPVWRRLAATLAGRPRRAGFASATASGALVAVFIGVMDHAAGPRLSPPARTDGFIGRGATEPQALFEARGEGFAFLLSPSEVRVVPSCPETPCRSIRVGFAGPAGSVRLVPERRRAPRPAYASVLLADLYPGIDVRFLDRAGGLRCAFLIDRGANPGSLRLDLDGADTVGVDADGALIAQGAGVRLVLPRLEARQVTPDGPATFPCGYSLAGPRSVVLNVRDYDVRRPLVVRWVDALRIERN
jgi:hypothetical protein